MNKSIITILLVILFSACSPTSKNLDDGTNSSITRISPIKNDDGTNKLILANLPVETPSKQKESKKSSSDKKPEEKKKQPKPVEVAKVSPSKQSAEQEKKVSEKTDKPKETIVKTEKPKSNTTDAVPGADAKASPFYFPIENANILKDFSLDERDKNPGIDFEAGEKTPIKNSSPGWVIYAGKKSGEEGEIAIIFHNEKYLTIYTHLDSLNIKKGDYLKSNDMIIGHASSYLHFELRQQTDKGIKTINPKTMLQKR